MSFGLNIVKNIWDTLFLKGNFENAISQNITLEKLKNKLTYPVFVLKTKEHQLISMLKDNIYWLSNKIWTK